MKTPEIQLAESVLTWFILKATSYRIVDNKDVKVLHTFDDWEFAEGQSSKPLYRKMIRNAFKVLKAQDPENAVYAKAKKIWNECPAYFEGSRQLGAPMGETK